MKKKTWFILIAILIVSIVIISLLVIKQDKGIKTYTISKTALNPIRSTLKINIYRYEEDLFALDTKNLAEETERLYGKYPEELIQNGIWEDSMMVEQLRLYLTDSVILQIYRKTISQYPDLEDIAEELKNAMAHYVFYYPDAKVPDFYTLVPGIDFMNPSVFEVNNNIFIHLDMYLGVDCIYYGKYGVPLYIRERYEKRYISIDCFKEAIVYRHLPKIKLTTLLDRMIFEGKKLYFTQLMFPEKSEKEIIGYTDAKYAWAEKYQFDVWNYIIGQDHLFSKSEQEISSYINESPFTKPFSSDSPGRLGSFIGWKIVKSYMDKNRDISLEELMQNGDANALLNKSGYKPSRR